LTVTSASPIIARVPRPGSGPAMNKRHPRIPNNVRALREEILMSKAELARKAGVSALTVDRIENGNDCRLDTKRKIILALGKKLEEKAAVFPDLADPKPVDHVELEPVLEEQEEG
jgi:DNA-binding XRE family transcriptional regulator